MLNLSFIREIVKSPSKLKGVLKVKAPVVSKESEDDIV